MTSLFGTWNVDLKTPIGTLHAQYRFEQTAQGAEGSATNGEETVALENVAVTVVVGGERATWHQKVSKPLRLNLDFDVVVVGNRMTGHSRAGRLPRTALTGERVES